MNRLDPLMTAIYGVRMDCLGLTYFQGVSRLLEKVLLSFLVSFFDYSLGSSLK